MNIWPWSKIKRLEAENARWIGCYMKLSRSRDLALKYMDSLEEGRHVFVADQLYIFKPDATWTVIENSDEVSYAAV